MTRKEIADFLRAHTHKAVLVTFDDGVTQSVTILSVDDEGFVHSGPPGDAEMYWTRFEGVESLQVENAT